MVFSREQFVHLAVTAQVLVASDPNAVPAAAAAAARGELVILPTDTVYGVATTAADESAVKRLFLAKRRPWDKGIPILIADVSVLEDIVLGVPSGAWKLMDEFWPGPLTIVLPKRPDLPDALSQTAAIAVRMPDLPVCRDIIGVAGGALAVTSANLSGHAPATTAEMALYDLAGYVSTAVDAGPSPMQQASTVVDCTVQPWRILRRGPIPVYSIMGASRG